MINPFTRIAGWQAFGLGLVFVIFMGIIGSYSNVSFNGALDVHFVQHMTLISSFSLLAIDIISLVLVMWIAGLILSKGFRFIDILGTMTLAKAPLIIIAFAGYFNHSIDQNKIPEHPLEMFQSISFIVLIILSIFITIWNVTLIYNAFRISCDVKGSKSTVAFIIGLLVAEVVSQIAIYKLM